MKKLLLILYLILISSGCGTFLKSTKPTPELSPKLSPIKKFILKKLSFLPFIEYRPSADPSPAKTELVEQLEVYEKIVDDHVQFNIDDKQGVDKELEKPRRKIMSKLFKRKTDKETIDEKIAEITIIRSLTVRYETWSLQWNEKTDLVESDLSLIEIKEIQKKLKRIYKKL